MRHCIVPAARFATSSMVAWNKMSGRAARRWGVGGLGAGLSTRYVSMLH